MAKKDCKILIDDCNNCGVCLKDFLENKGNTEFVSENEITEEQIWDIFDEILKDGIKN